MLLPFNAEIFFYPKPIDFRKQLNGLINMVVDVLDMNPTSGQIFIFRNKSSKKLKIIYWDKNGFWLLYRRLEEGRFKFPKPNEYAIQLTTEQFQWLLSGLDIKDYTPVKAQRYSEFY